MPIYEYACDACQREFEALVRVDEPVSCPGCGGRELERKFSVPAIGRSNGASLPIADLPRGGGCGAAACQSRCQFD